jgi:hypothetical protein
MVGAPKLLFTSNTRVLIRCSSHHRNISRKYRVLHSPLNRITITSPPHSRFAHPIQARPSSKKHQRCLPKCGCPHSLSGPHVTGSRQEGRCLRLPNHFTTRCDNQQRRHHDPRTPMDKRRHRSAIRQQPHRPLPLHQPPSTSPPYFVLIQHARSYTHSESVLARAQAKSRALP